MSTRKSTRKSSRKIDIRKWFKKRYTKVKQRINSYLKRRPHRSFRRTRRRDLPKRANLPSNIMFTTHVLSFLKNNKKSFIIIVFLYVFAYTIVAGIGSQENYSTLTTSLQEMGSSLFDGKFDKSSETFVLFTAAIMGGFSTQLTEIQRVYIGLILIFMWLVVIWVSRHRFALVKIKVRDALYNAGSPLLPTILITLIGLVQLIPAAIGILAYNTLLAIGFIDTGATAMLFSLGAFLTVLLSAYWLVSTFIALIVVTVPGTYPMQALKIAGDIVIGRRVQVLLRLFWMLLCVVALWAIILVPVILIADILPWDWLPLVPVTVQVLGALSFIFSSVYIYILYRGMIDEPITVKRA